MNEPTKAWAIIPARGGSVGIPRKNLRELAGRPLIAHAIGSALAVLPPERVLVVTDDTEIAQVAQAHGASVILETEATPSDETLDTKILRNLPRLCQRGAQPDDPILTIQPTSPLLRPQTIRAAIAAFGDPGIRSVLTVAEDRHLRWRPDPSGRVVPSFAARVNRQQLPMEYRETGGVIAARLADIESAGTRVIEPVHVLPLADDEAVDIDSYADLYAAAHLLSRRRIAIRVDAGRELGMGHVYRMLAFASELARHELVIYLSEDQPLGAAFFARYPYRVVIVSGHADFISRLADFDPALVVFDILDTDTDDIARVRDALPGAAILSFEDRGTGASSVDLLVTEFVDSPGVPPQRTLAGIEHALLAPAFEAARRECRAPAAEVDEVLVLFGGTDPSMLAGRALASLARCGFTGRVTMVRGLGAEPVEVDAAALPFVLDVRADVRNMPELMARADLAYTSAGRTIIELLACGTPAICLAQNEKELTHTHATEANGILPLGLGRAVTDAQLDAATDEMLRNAERRREFADRARAAGAKRSNRKTIAEILSRVGFADFPEI